MAAAGEGPAIAIDFLEHDLDRPRSRSSPPSRAFAVGIGTTMLLHCDLAFAGHSAPASACPSSRLGLCPEGGSSYLLPLVAGIKAPRNC